MKNTINLTGIKQASINVSQTTDTERNNFLHTLSALLEKNAGNIVWANNKDRKMAKENNVSSAFIQRLLLDTNAIQKLVIRLEDMQKLKKYDGKVVEKKVLENGIRLKKVAVPIGVIFVLYESRPEVTIDIAALCIKSGNVLILKGGFEARNTNKVLYQCIQEALRKTHISTYAVSLIKDRNTASSLLKENNYIDLVIARGGYTLVKKVMDQSSIPVLAHAAGGARIYVDKSADLQLAEKIIINAKISKPSACNSLDTILVHKDIASLFVPKIVQKLTSYGVEIISNDWEREFLDMKMNIKIVHGVDEAIAFITTYSKRHSEGIIARDKKIIDAFVHAIDAAAVFVNCSTRFHDGYEFGMGAEMGIATGKLHARGPVGLKELTTYKWEVYGNGNIRE